MSVLVYRTLVRNYSIAVKKRITRIPSEYSVTEEEVESGARNSNDRLPVLPVNRNPRNLEQISFQPKPLGFELNGDFESYWNKIEFNKNTLVAKLIHFSDKVILGASVSEQFLKDKFSNDISAATNLGKIMARRCLESGFIHVHFNPPEDELLSPKVQAFKQGLEENGLSLKEPQMIFPRRKRDM